MQPAFGHPDSPWFTPSIDTVAERIETLVPLFGRRVIFTRFVPPAQPTGSWVQYYERWPFARDPASDWLWQLLPRWADRASVASHRFSKWREVSALLPPTPTLVLCGVSTDCCVLATALAAVDDGAHVRLVADACAAKTPEIHQSAVENLATRAPALAVVSAAEERAFQDHAA